jgi:LmbE family N-acetylglucosaminyl deacetylase
MNTKNVKNIALIVAHPDDETLWAGGTILTHPEWNWFVVCMTRATDKERAPRFYDTLNKLGCQGVMGKLDDGPEQHLLKPKEMEEAILRMLPNETYDIIITHNASGEYTRHIRHEEVNRAVFYLWEKKLIHAKEVWTFAYQDGNGAYFPEAQPEATYCELLSEDIWYRKYAIITETYGFDKTSWEAKTTPQSEAFWQFKNLHPVVKYAKQWCEQIKVAKFEVYKLLKYQRV